jgi:phage anti-repressor protein
MNELIKIELTELNGELVQTCNARELWQFVESKQRFADWIKNRIERYNFTQAIDFVVIDKIMKDDSGFGGQRKIIDYYISIDMAKELAMVEHTKKGKQVRKYFIECERKLKALNQTPKLPNFTDPAEAAIAWAAEYKAKQAALTFSH